MPRLVGQYIDHLVSSDLEVLLQELAGSGGLGGVSGGWGVRGCGDLGGGSFGRGLAFVPHDIVIFMDSMGSNNIVQRIFGWEVVSVTLQFPSSGTQFQIQNRTKEVDGQPHPTKTSMWRLQPGTTRHPLITKSKKLPETIIIPFAILNIFVTFLPYDYIIEMENRDSKVLVSRGIRSLNKPSRHNSNKKQSPLGRTIQYRQSVTLKAVEQSIKKSKSSGKCLLESPYLEHTFRSRLVKLLKPNKSLIISNEIQVKNTGIEDQEGTINIEIKFKGIRLKCKIKAEDTASLFEALRKQVIKACNERGGDYTRQAIKIIGFQTLENNREIDYALTIEGKQDLRSLSLKPIVYHKSKSISLRDFKIIKSLGSGGFSHVYLVRAKFNGNFYALKLMEKEFIMENERDLIVENERYILEVTDSPFLIKLFHAFETKRYFAFVIEYCSGGELFYRLKEIKRMSEEEAKFYFVEILFGIKYLHQKNILYRDLKPENLLIGNDGHMKIADFGLAKPNVQVREQSYSFCGSPEYMAPEMLCKSGHSFTLDYYCLGALLYELVTGLPPYYSKDHDQIYDSILNEQLVIPDHYELSPELQNFLKGLLHKDPKMRLGGYSGIKEILIHPWIGKLNVDDILNKKMIPPYVPSKYLFNFDKSSQEEVTSLSGVLKQQENQESFKSYFSDSFQFSVSPSAREANMLQELKSYDKREMDRKSIQEISKGIRWKDDAKWTHRTPLKLRSMNNQTFSSRLQS